MAAYGPCAGRRAGFLGGLAVSLVLLIPATCWADLASYFSSAVSGCGGSLTLTGGGTKPKARIEYAVFPAGVFGSLFGTANDPSGGTEYVYAYQLINDDTVRKLTYFSVALDSGNGATDIGELASSTGTSVNGACSFPGTSAVWNYTSSPIPVSGNSKILLFVSPHDPTWLGATLKGDGGITSYYSGLQVPSPSQAPEPSTAVILSVAGVCFVLFRSMRLKRSR